MAKPLLYYSSLLTSEYRGAVRMNVWLDANLQLFQDVTVCASAFPAAFDIDIASGPQLDILGSILGQSRELNFQPTIGNPILDDADYQILLKAGIAKNHWDGKLGSLLGIWKGLFPGGTLLIVDGQNMAVTLYVAGAFTSMIQDLILHGFILPRPQGVKYTYVLATPPIFGFDRDDEYVSGFDTGRFS